MSWNKDYNSFLALGFETDYNKPPVECILMPIDSEAMDYKRTKTDPTTMRGIRAQEAPVFGNVDISGGITFPLDTVALGYVLRAAFGLPTTTGTTPAFSHAFKPGNTQPSFCAEKQFTDAKGYDLLSGLKVNKLTFNFGDDKNTSYVAEIIGADRVLGAKTAFTTTEKALLDYTRFFEWQGTVKEGGLTTGIITKGTIVLDFGLQADTYAIGSKGIRTKLEPTSPFKVTGQLTLFFEDTLMVEKTITGATSSLEFALTDSDGPSFTISIPEVVYEPAIAKLEASKGTMLTINYNGFVSNPLDAAASIVLMTLANGHADYTKLPATMLKNINNEV
ncbi:MAG: phage tail tube protein [Bacillota bacterium]